MAKKSRLTRVAVKIGSAIGRADRKAHQIVKAGTLAKKELADISKQVDALKRQLQTATKRLRRALTQSSPRKGRENSPSPRPPRRTGGRGRKKRPAPLGTKRAMV